ncbi:ABC transporter substrate-binding protein [Aeromicrobium camelliae]|uniref:ABC transporter substrate-binding protein n=1 Tax=Aeromicrobium camelliae TaxID=1538144 RepID=A0A3N6YXE3_9ACTN|nr:ABC transporter substrate-binding protein [Aeromicrobium camelliae]RQN02421.1 ABC transporter substrate-binding protein [Aeromicrobium camelliae]
MKLSKLSLSIAGAVAAALTMSACSGSSSDAGENTSLVVAMGHEAPYPGEEAVMYAIPKGLGLFEKYGIDVQFQPTAGSGVAIQLVQAGEADLGQGNPSSVMAAVDKGVDIKVVYNIIPTYGSGLAVLPDSPITSPKDLADTTIGVASLSSSRLPEAQAMVAEAGLTDSVEFVAVGVGAQAASALTSGKVDGLYLWDAAYKSIELSGTPLRVIRDVFTESAQLLDFVQYASADAIENKADAIEKLGKAAAVAHAWAKENPEKALDLFYEEFPNARSDEAGRQRDLAILTFTLEQFDPEGTDQSGFGDTPEKRTTTTAKFLADHQLIPKALAAEEYVDNQFVPAYNEGVEDDLAQLSGKE